MNTNQRKTVKSVAQKEVLGELHVGDQLYNALHGVGDITLKAKFAVFMVMHDFYYPAQRIASKQDTANPDYAGGRDEIIKIVRACLDSVPKIVQPILERWIDEVKTDLAARTAQYEGEGTRMTKDEMFLQLRAQGYEIGNPCSIDEEICEESICDCGHEGLDYFAFRKTDSYRAVSVCPNCDTTEEF